MVKLVEFGKFACVNRKRFRLESFWLTMSIPLYPRNDALSQSDFLEFAAKFVMMERDKTIFGNLTDLQSTKVSLQSSEPGLFKSDFWLKFSSDVSKLSRSPLSSCPF